MTVAGVGCALTLQLSLNSNFVAEEMHVTGFQQGLLETFRETCGIVAFGALAILAGLAEPLIGALMLILFAAGLSAYAFVPDFFWLVLVSLVWSQGSHIWMPLPNSMALALAKPGREGYCLGKVHAFGAAGACAGLLIALILHIVKMHIRSLYLVAGAVLFMAAFTCIVIPWGIKTPGARIVFRKRYSLYYLLNFLEGWRKQIFIAFAGFLLVRMHGTPLITMLVLWLIIQGVNLFTSPLAGRLIDRFGERTILVFYYASLAVFFVGYAFISNKYLLYSIYIVDGLFFVFVMALTTYVNRIAPLNEHTATLSMGVAFNHIAAVIMPLCGGLAWKYLGYQWTFVIGAAAAAISVFVSLFVPAHLKKVKGNKYWETISSALPGNEPE
ncbi:MAG: MFS transporter [Sedimentisphaerales bacterium]|nr:MFS transporter [Sedimentisphaerales bacterium]